MGRPLAEFLTPVQCQKGLLIASSGNVSPTDIMPFPPTLHDELMGRKTGFPFSFLIMSEMEGLCSYLKPYNLSMCFLFFLIGLKMFTVSHKHSTYIASIVLLEVRGHLNTTLKYWSESQDNYLGEK